MLGFLPKIYLDFSSFWIGFLAGVLFVILYRRLRPALETSWDILQSQWADFSSRRFSSNQEQIRQRVYEYAQRQHLASPLFALEQLVVPPRLLTPTPQVIPDQDTPDPTLLQQTIPYLPDHAHLSAVYQAPTFSLEDAAALGANLVVLGKTGAGKTTALAYFASRMAKREFRAQPLNQKFPLLLDAKELVDRLPGGNPLEVIAQLVDSNPHLIKAGSAVPALVELLRSVQVFLLLDGTDELPSPQIDQVVSFLSRLEDKHPEIQMITTASPQSLDGLLGSSFQPVVLAGWSEQERNQFTKKWAAAWENLPLEKEDPLAGEELSTPYFLNSWLGFHHQHFTPLEFSLQTWAAYAGDLIGSGPWEALESYLRRTAVQLPQQDLVTLQVIAYASLLEGKVNFSRQTITRWTKSSEFGRVIQWDKTQSNPLGQLLQVCVDNHLLHRHGEGESYSFTHLTLAGFLASKAFHRIPDADLTAVLNQPDWAYRFETLRYYDPTPAPSRNKELFLNHEDLLESRLLIAGEWLKFIEPSHRLRDQILQAITKVIHQSPLLEVKIRLTGVLADSGDPQVPGIFRHLLKSGHRDIMHAAALGAGTIRDYKSVPILIQALKSPPPVSYAACFALVRIGTPPALEAVADVLLSAGEMLRRAAASALANHPEEGHPALKDGSTMDDLMIRYAVVFGLKRINKRWAVEILDDMRINEEEWIVRDAAQHAYEDLVTPPPSTPRPQPNPEEISWLRTFATSVGASPPGGRQDVLPLLLQALDEGTQEQKIAALDMIRREGYQDVFPALHNALFGSEPAVRREAYLTLWYLAAAGLKLPPLPNQSH